MTILEQVEKLAAAQKSGEKVSHYSHTRTVVSCEADHADFPALLAELKRLYRVEERARAFTVDSMPWRFHKARGTLNEAERALDAALSEPRPSPPRSCGDGMREKERSAS